MADDPPPKPMSLKDRIKAFESQSPSSGVQAPPRPAPGRFGGTWKPAAQIPDTDTSSTLPGKKTFSATDAAESIGKGSGSLKERMALLQGKGAFGAPAGKPEPPPKPKFAPKWTIPSEEEKKEELPGEQKPPEGTVPHQEEVEQVNFDEETEKRAAIAARIARLGGAKLGMGAPVFAKQPIRSPPAEEKPESVPQAAAESYAARPPTPPPPEAHPTNLPTDSPSRIAVAPEPSVPEDTPPATQDLPSPPGIDSLQEVSAPSSSPMASAAESESTVPAEDSLGSPPPLPNQSRLLVHPKRAGPPRKKKSAAKLPEPEKQIDNCDSVHQKQEKELVEDITTSNVSGHAPIPDGQDAPPGFEHVVPVQEKASSHIQQEETPTPGSLTGPSANQDQDPEPPVKKEEKTEISLPDPQVREEHPATEHLDSEERKARVREKVSQMGGISPFALELGDVKSSERTQEGLLATASMTSSPLAQTDSPITPPQLETETEGAPPRKEEERKEECQATPSRQSSVAEAPVSQGEEEAVPPHAERRGSTLLDSGSDSDLPPHPPPRQTTSNEDVLIHYEVEEHKEEEAEPKARPPPPEPKIPFPASEADEKDEPPSPPPRSHPHSKPHAPTHPPPPPPEPLSATSSLSTYLSSSTDSEEREPLYINLNTPGVGGVYPIVSADSMSSVGTVVLEDEDSPNAAQRMDFPDPVPHHPGQGGEVLDEDEGDPIDPGFISPSRRVSGIAGGNGGTAPGGGVGGFLTPGGLAGLNAALRDAGHSVGGDDEEKEGRVGTRLEDDTDDPTSLAQLNTTSSPLPMPEPEPHPGPSASEDRESEDEEATRRKMIAERMARLGGIKFGMAPPPAKKQSLPTPQLVEGESYQPSEEGTSKGEAGDSEHVLQEPSQELDEEAEEAARKDRIAKKMASGMLGAPGVIMGGYGMGMASPFSPGIKHPPVRSPSSQRQESESKEVEQVPLPSRATRPPVPRSSVPSPPTTESPASESSPPRHHPIQLPTMKRMSLPKPSGPPPPLPPPTEEGVAYEGEEDMAQAEEVPPPPPPRRAHHPPTSSLSKSPPPQNKALSPSSPIPATRSHAPVHNLAEPSPVPWVERPAETHHGDDSWEMPDFDMGHKESVDLSLSSPSSPSNQPSQQSSSSATITADELMDLWGKIGVQVLESSSTLYEKATTGKKGHAHVVGDGTYEGFVKAVLELVPTTPPFTAEDDQWGHAIYEQTGGVVKLRVVETLPGDVVFMRDARFKGHKGLQAYHQHLGDPYTDPYIGVISEFDAKKSKMKVLAARRGVGDKSVESTSFKLEDLKSGTVKVYRVRDRTV